MDLTPIEQDIFDLIEKNTSEGVPTTSANVIEQLKVSYMTASKYLGMLSVRTYPDGTPLIIVKDYGNLKVYFANQNGKKDKQ